MRRWFQVRTLVASFLCAALWLSLLTRAARAQSIPVIDSAVVNHTNSTMTITGVNFGLRPAVTLGGVSLTAKTDTSTQIVVAFPAASPPSGFIPGTYFLEVTFSNGTIFVFAVSLGTAGP